MLCTIALLLVADFSFFGVKPGMSKWRIHLFLILSYNAMDAAGFFDIPSNQVIEVGAQLEL